MLIDKEKKITCMQNFPSYSRQRPYHVEHTSSRPITEVKQHWARLVLGWETAWEHRVLLSSFHLFSLFLILLLSLFPNFFTSFLNLVHILYFLSYIY